MKYIIYNSNGNILNQVMCQEKEIENYISDELMYMEYEDSPINKIVINGEVVDNSADIEATNSNAQKEITVSQYRNVLLYGCDWTQLPDSPLSDSKKKEWATYRQELRDITETYPDTTSIDDIIWPNKPE